MVNSELTRSLIQKLDKSDKMSSLIPGVSDPNYILMRYDWWCVPMTTPSSNYSHEMYMACHISIDPVVHWNVTLYAKLGEYHIKIWTKYYGW